MANAGSSGSATHRANPLFWVVGLAVGIVGLAVMAVGVIAMIDYFQQPDPLQGDGAAEFADAFVFIAQGGVVQLPPTFSSRSPSGRSRGQSWRRSARRWPAKRS